MNRLSPLSRKTPLKQRKPLSREPMRRKPRPAVPATVQRYWDSLPSRCEGCGHWDHARELVVIHHILAEAPGKIGRRDDTLVVKLCPLCHNMGTKSVHLLGSEAAFKRETGVDLVAIAVRNRDAWEAANG